MNTQYIKSKKALTRMAGILLLAVGFMTSAVMAQDNQSKDFRPIGYYIGVETAAGTLEPTSGIHFGDTVVMNSFSEWETYCLTVSVDYSTTQFVPDSYIVTGGSWSLVVFRENVYAGTLYGEIPSGNVLISTNSNGGQIQLTQLNLKSTGGLGAFDGKKSKDISGVYSTTTDLRSSHAEGNVAFSF